jgi:hypothetical protein
MTPNKIVNGAIIPLTDGELTTLQAKDADWKGSESSRISSDVRNQREQLFKDTDWMALSDSPVMSAEWAAYRQALRDVTAQTGFPYDVIWPTKPE